MYYIYGTLIFVVEITVGTVTTNLVLTQLF